MNQYINKSAVIAEIKKIYNEDYKFLPSDLVESVQNFKDDLLMALDTLEVKEVDFEKEIENLIEKEKAFVTDNKEVKYYNGDSFNHIYELEFIAKHFFELGLAQKGE
jgi:hypothetical protein